MKMKKRKYKVSILMGVFVLMLGSTCLMLSGCGNEGEGQTFDFEVINTDSEPEGVLSIH